MKPGRTPPTPPPTHRDVAMTTSTLTIEAHTGDKPVASLIILHGLGASGDDFIPLAKALDLSAIGPVRFVMPQAPVRPVTINGGHAMPAWYDIYPDRRVEDEAGLRASQALVEALLAREAARGVPAERTVLAGFSQGCAMALLTGLRHAHRLAGVVGMSGYLPLADKTVAERHPANAHTPIFLAHGTQDDIVVPARAEASRDALQAMGQNVAWHTYPMGHSLCQPEVDDLNDWLLTVLA